MAPRTVYANLADGLQPFQLWDASLADMGNLGTVPCTAVGTNAIVLTPIASVFAPTVTIPQALQEFSFVAAASSSSSVTVQVGTTAALKLYRMDGVTQASTGDLVATVTYVINYNAALNSAAGGFQILAPIANEINPIISGATITNSTYNGLTITSTTGALTIAAGKTETFNNTLTFAGTDSTVMTFPTTSATLARTDAANTFTGTQTVGALVATTINGNTVTAGTGILTIAAAKTLTVNNSLILAGTDATTMTFPTTSATIARTDAANTFTGTQTIGTLVATTLNGNTFTAGTYTITGVAAKTLTFSNTLTFSGTDASTLAIGVGGTLTGSSSAAIWYDNIPQNSQSAAYGLVLSDAQKHILHPTADNNPRTFTIPANASVAYPIGTAIMFVNQINTVTIAITTDTLTLAGTGGTGSRTLAANGIANAIKITATSWMISGTGLS